MFGLSLEHMITMKKKHVQIGLVQTWSEGRHSHQTQGQ